MSGCGFHNIIQGSFQLGQGGVGVFVEVQLTHDAVGDGPAGSGRPR
jgi:hypothetical protein